MTLKTRKATKKGVILLSGGIDSAVTLYLAKKKGYELTALIFDYNQRHRKEIGYAEEIAKLNKIRSRIVKLNLGWAKSSLTDKLIQLPLNRNVKSKVPSTYVSGRNIIFLSCAFSLAESIGAKAVFIGAHIQDYPGYPDCRPEFLYNFQRAVNLGMEESRIKISAPLIDKGKKEIVQIGLELNVPFKHTWSCYKGSKYPCLECDSCRFRTRAFEELRIKDPLLK